MNKQEIQEQQYIQQGAYHWKLNPDERWWEIKDILRYNHLVSLALSYSPKLVLDVGCGDGYLTSKLSEFARVIGIDISKVGLGHFKECARGVEGICANAKAIPFGDETFDLVVSSETLEHLPEDIEESAISEIYRVLRPNGRFIFSVPSKKVPVAQKHERHYDERDLRKKLTEFSELDIYGLCPEIPIIDFLFRVSQNNYFHINNLRKLITFLYKPLFQCSSSRGQSLVGISKKSF